MKYLYIIVIACTIMGCNFQNIEIRGTTPGKDGDVVSIINLEGTTILAANIKSGRYEIVQQPLPAYGYYTLSVMSGGFPHDFEVYLEPGKYTIDIPKKDGDYPKIITDSKVQRSLSTYYNFENSVMAKYREEKDMWVAKLNDPKIKTMPQAEFSNILAKVASTRDREHGLHIAVMDMFINKYPKNDIVPHIITNMDYQTDPYPYYILYKKLSPEAQNSDEGKKIGKELQQLVKQTEQKKTPKPISNS